MCVFFGWCNQLLMKSGISVLELQLQKHLKFLYKHLQIIQQGSTVPFEIISTRHTHTQKKFKKNRAKINVYKINITHIPNRIRESIYLCSNKESVSLFFEYFFSLKKK